MLTSRMTARGRPDALPVGARLTEREVLQASRSVLPEAAQAALLHARQDDSTRGTAAAKADKQTGRRNDKG